MKLSEHFKTHLHPDLKMARQCMVDSILNDGEALRELDEATELWLDADLDKLGPMMYELAQAYKDPAGYVENERKDRDLNVHGIVRISVDLARIVRNLWIDGINNYLDEMFETVNLQQLAEDYHQQERVDE